MTAFQPATAPVPIICTSPAKNCWDLEKGHKRTDFLASRQFRVLPQSMDPSRGRHFLGLKLPLLIFRGESVRGGIFDEGVTDVFNHDISDGNLRNTKLEAFREVLLKWSAKSASSTIELAIL